MPTRIAGGNGVRCNVRKIGFIWFSVGLLMLVAAPGIAGAQDGAAQLAAAEPIAIGIAEIDFTDTSGELTDQQAVHDTRRRDFAAALRNDLLASGKYRIVELNCGKAPCSVDSQIPSDLIDAAKRAGARLLLYGGVHKMSTLIQNMKAQVVDIQADKLVLDRLISFRGDTDEAWQRVEQFLAKELIAQTPAE
jgi:hypothetical protein